MSNDPYSPENHQFFAREVNYLIELGVKNFEKWRFMESNMVNSVWLKSTIGVIKKNFQKELPQFTMTKNISHGPYWSIEFAFDEVTVKIQGDIAFSICICIENSNFHLWQYDRSVNDKMKTSEENILYQLNILKLFLESK